MNDLPTPSAWRLDAPSPTAYTYTHADPKDPEAVPMFTQGQVMRILCEQHEIFGKTLERWMVNESMQLARAQHAESVVEDLLVAGGKMALNLECLLLEMKDTAVTSKWWDEGLSAIEQWRFIKDQA